MKAPYAFAGPYAGCYEDVDMAMDPRHVFMLHGILSAWPFNHALELGCWKGASSTAFVQAMNAGTLQTATFCDTMLQDSMNSVLKNCNRPVRFEERNSWDVLSEPTPYDFIFVDANHDVGSVTQELRWLNERKPLCVMGHDTNATAAGYGYAEGAKLLKDTFQSKPEYLCIEDALHRHGEQTHRGLFLATTDEDLYRIAQEVFKNYGSET